MANGSTPISAASAKSVRSGRRSTAAAPSTPKPASDEADPGAEERRHVLQPDGDDDPRARPDEHAGGVQTPDDRARHGARGYDSARESRPDDRGPGGCDLGRLGRAGRCLRALWRARRCSAPTTTCPSSGETERGSLDAWGTINALAARTTTLRLGTMVSPTSFRHPSVLAKLVDDRRPRVRRAHRPRPGHRLVGDRAHARTASRSCR